ncbi:MAG: class I SAM-dependent methyltransferase [Cyclobacteriaceae bacterium]|nr:class I SAM-dependent methyltransferase [Cyclobacteriaceae bacterium HetDA_MAG_MS6]
MVTSKPIQYQQILSRSKELGFDMVSDESTGTLLRSLVTSKPSANILELGTGTCLALSWILSGMDNDSKVTSVDNDERLLRVAKEFLGSDERVKLICKDGKDWIDQYKGRSFDLIFADTWPGKYSELPALLDLLEVGGLYIIDDMLPQPNWPEGHDKSVENLLDTLEKRDDLNLSKIEWSTGIVIASKKY